MNDDEWIREMCLWIATASMLIDDPHSMSEPCKREFSSKGAKMVDDYLEQKLEESYD